MFPSGHTPALSAVFTGQVCSPRKKATHCFHLLHFGTLYLCLPPCLLHTSQVLYHCPVCMDSPILEELAPQPLEAKVSSHSSVPCTSASTQTPPGPIQVCSSVDSPNTYLVSLPWLPRRLSHSPRTQGARGRLELSKGFSKQVMHKLSVKRPGGRA